MSLCSEYRNATCIYVRACVQITDENESHYIADNCMEFGCASTSDMSNKMHGMNGRIYANLEGLEMTVGDNVRWFVASFGSQVITDDLNRVCIVRAQSL